MKKILSPHPQKLKLILIIYNFLLTIGTERIYKVKINLRFDYRGHFLGTYL